MGYRSNLGCLWLLLLIMLIGGTPLMIGVLRLFAAFALFALAAGAALSWWIRRHAVLQYRSARGVRSTRFVELLVALLVKLAEIDGELDRREVTAIRRFFEQRLGYRQEQLLWIRDLIKESRRSSQTVDSICQQLSAAYGLQERLIVLQVLVRVAEADGAVTPREAEFIRQAARLLGLAPFVGGFGFEQPGEPAGAGVDRRVDEALAALGLRRGASREQIKQAWRRLSMENHPDRVTHLGQEFRELAEERMRVINAAYDVLKQAGMAS